MKRLHLIQGLLKMKKWYGGLLIMTLVMMLVFLYGYKGFQPQKQSAKQSAYNFFHNQQLVDDYVNGGSSAPPVNSSKVDQKRVPLVPRERPHLIHVDGLNDLYGMKNLTEREMNTVIVWSYLHSLLSRSDALPETAQGVKEASVTWKKLLSMVEEDKVSRINNTESPENQNCPFSVTTFGKTISGSGITLELPCGLVEDSSITIIGIPNGNSSFQIVLIGQELEEKPNPPIILYYNIRVPQDNMTEEPYIVQNTWTSNFGWGKEERCPARGSANQKVDGFALCNVQVGSNNEDNVNVGQPTSDVTANVSSESAHRTGNFPFAEGNPFTATLWVGSEGFHMTINGRHETSFAYREKLEPWLVNNVKVAGSLNLLSVLAKGLPVMEDSDLVDVDKLKAPSITRKKLVLLIGVFSTGNNFERRMALRRSWMQYEAVRSGEVAVRFFIGLHKNNRVNFELWSESQAYGDIQLMPFVDYYSLITLKTIAICIMGTKVMPSKYIMKTDDDAFVRIDEVLSSLKGKPSNGLLFGLISSKSSPERDKESKWYISEKEWPYDTYPPWAHGPGYVISRDIAKFIVNGHQERKLQLFKLEDVAMGIWIEQFKNGGKEVHYENDERFYNVGCESNYVLAHYQSPRLVLCLWDKLQKEHQPRCCE